MNENINDQEIDQTVFVTELISGASVGTWQADYPLTGRDYEHLRSGKPITYLWAHSILLTSFGIGLNLFGKYISKQLNTEVIIYIGEYIAFGVGLILAIILYLIGLCLPNDRRKIMNKLKAHFDSSPKKRQLVKEEDQ